MRFPWGLFKPLSFAHETPAGTIIHETIADTVVPLVFMMYFAAISSIPVFQVKGVWMAVSYTLISFLVLCFLRRWMLFWHGPRISPSALGVIDMGATIFPSLFLILLSFEGAFQLWGWKL